MSTRRVWIKGEPFVRVLHRDGTVELLSIPREDHDRLRRLDGRAKS